MTPAATKRSDPEDRTLADGVLDDLVQMAFAVTAVLTRVGGTHDLSLTLLRLLGILRGRRPKMAQLADHLGLEKSTVSGLVDRAEARGLVERSASPEDGRAVCVGLTSKGRRLARIIEGEVAAALTSATGELTTQDQKQIHAVFSRLLGQASARMDL